MGCINSNKVIGTIAIKKLRGNNGTLKKMFVDSSFRGEAQIGKKLLFKVFEYCQENDIKNVYLGTTSKFKAAQRFYKKNGFVEACLEDFPKDFPILAVDNIFLLKKILQAIN